MENQTTQISPALEAVEIKSIQPGGGRCFDLELAWGRLRRAYLRRLRPGYVKRMTGLRQGQCGSCAHDIIDPRDLKPYRNVCGYWFRPEDDAFAWRGELGLARAGLAEIVCFSVLIGLTLSFLTFLALGVHGIFWVGASIVFLLWCFIISFFRDPRRVVPADPDALVSPADGTVTHIGEVEDPDFPDGRALRISIFLSVFNVHVNRMPRAGRVTRVQYFPGCFLDARHSECAIRNEQLWIDLEEPEHGRTMRIKQISGAIARRIVCWLKPGDAVARAERFGMIKFGSRTEILLPVGEAITVLVNVGDTVKGGSTTLLRFHQ